MTGSERLGPDQERAHQQLLGFRIFLLLDQHIGEAVLRGCDGRIPGGEILQFQFQRLAQIRLSAIELVSLGISLAAILQQYRDVLMSRPESLDHSGMTSLIIEIMLS